MEYKRKYKMIERPDIFKTVLLGDGGVGKTSLRKRYLGLGFQYSYNMTIGADFGVKNVDLDGEQVVSQVWDLAGQPRFANIREVYYRGSTGAILVFDKTRPSTFASLPTWIDELLKNNDNRILPMVIVGNKTDIERDFPNSVKFRQATKYAKELSKWAGFQIPYVETSAKGENSVDSVFRSVLRKSMDQIKAEAKLFDKKRMKFRKKKVLKEKYENFQDNLQSKKLKRKRK